MREDWPAPAILGKQITVKQGTQLARAGAEVFEVHLIVEGVIGRLVTDGRHDVIDAVRTATWLMGAVAAMTTSKYAATVVALTPCALRPIHIRAFREALGIPDVSNWIRDMLAADLLSDATRRTAIASHGTRSMVEELFVELMQVAGKRGPDGSVRLTIPLNTVDVARLVGVTREHMSRVLSELEADGWVIRVKGWFVAPSRSPLHQRFDIPQLRP